MTYTWLDIVAICAMVFLMFLYFLRDLTTPKCPTCGQRRCLFSQQETQGVVGKLEMQEIDRLRALNMKMLEALRGLHGDLHDCAGDRHNCHVCKLIDNENKTATG